jgi:hypothetical protein
MRRAPCRWRPPSHAAPGMPISTRAASSIRADHTVAAGQVDVVGMTRADRRSGSSAQGARASTTSARVGPNEGCIDRIYQGKPVRPEPATAARPSSPVQRRRSPRRSSWSVAASRGWRRHEWRRRGHRVVLFEKRRLAALAPARSPVRGHRALPRRSEARGGRPARSRGHAVRRAGGRPMPSSSRPGRIIIPLPATASTS